MPDALSPENAAAGAATLDSRLRGNDGIVNGGLSFADYYKREQARLLSALDNALSQKAESVITENFAAVKKAGVQLQTKLGGRKSNIGVNVIGSFAETDNEAFGWHLRGYGGDEDTFGANAGIFYREIDGGMLFGANAFVDYEDGDDGKFSRVGIGGEIKHENAGVVVNYYAPIGGAQEVNSTVAAFSRRGFDAKVRISAPYFSALKAAADYYNFAGKDGVKDEDGLRYGAELHLSPGFQLGVFYDDGAEKVGGELSYLHTFNSSPSPSFPQNSSSFLQNSSSFLRKQESPDLFAAVSREYSQRIVTVETGPGISLRLIPTLTVTTAMTMPGRTVTTAMTAFTFSTTTMTVGVVTTTTTMTAAGIVSTTTVTAASITTAMTVTNDIIMPSRVASVLASVQLHGIVQGNMQTYRVETLNRVLVTLPSADTMRPHVLTVNRNFTSITVRVIDSTHTQFVPVGSSIRLFNDAVETYTLTIVQGSEQHVGEPTITSVTTSTTTTMAGMTTTTTMTAAGAETETTMTLMGVVVETTMTMTGIATTTTMTILPVSTTTRITTFATTTITLGATSAAGADYPVIPAPLVIPAQAGISQTIAAKAAHAQKEIPAVAGMTGYMMDSRLRGNDGLLLPHNDGGGKFLVVAKPPPPVLVAASFRHSRAAGAGISHSQKEIPALSRENDGKRRE